MEGIVFSNVNEIVKNKEIISEIQHDDTWGVMPYEAGYVKGNALITREYAKVDDVILQPKLTGWHKIFVCSSRMDGGFCFQIKFDNEEHYTIVSNSSQPSKVSWNYNECMEEIFWCCADLSDREIFVHKAGDRITTLAWLRCVPMTEEEVAEYKDYVNADGKRNLHVHFDNDTNLYHGCDDLDGFLRLMYTVKDTDTKICTQEIMDDSFDEDVLGEHDRLLDARMARYVAENRKAAAKMDEVTKARLDMMHGMGVKMYAGYRMSLGRYAVPFAPLSHFSIMKNQALYCETRDGRFPPICSYAYPETRRFSIDYIKRAVKRGYDGVSLITHRGILMGFEKPVRDEFARRYGTDIDVRRVPMDDPRLKDIWGDFFAQFVRELRDELDAEFGRHIPINVITGYSPECGRRMGVDVELLCKEGLIDHFCGEAMDHYEVTTDYLAEDGLIDLEKYKELLHEKFMVHRCFSEKWERTKEGVPQFMAIAEKYGVEYFAGMSPSGGSSVKRVEWIEGLRELGVKNFSFFNFCHDGSRDRTVVHAATKTAHTPNPEYYLPKFYRVLSLDGIDMSTYVSSWRG